MSCEQLQSHLEENPYAFIVMSGAAAFITALVTLSGLRRCVGVALWPIMANGWYCGCVFFGFGRLAKIRKVGLSAGSAPRRSRPWISLPLRRRGENGDVWRER